jgi:hypothetical protein
MKANASIAAPQAQAAREAALHAFAVRSRFTAFVFFFIRSASSRRLRTT